MYYLALIPISALAVSFCVGGKYFTGRKKFTYTYDARTTQPMLNHRFVFSIEKHDYKEGYRCYIESQPPFRGRDTTNYIPHFWRIIATDRRYICWTGAIRCESDAMELCRMWADATQQFIDTGIPAAGFGRS